MGTLPDPRFIKEFIDRRTKKNIVHYGKDL